MERNVNGLCNVKCRCAHHEKFTEYYGWRDPDLTNKPRMRSIPNRMKRFMAELKGELTMEKDKHHLSSRGTNNGSIYTRSSIMTGSTVTNNSKSTSQLHDAPLLVNTHGPKIAVEDFRRWARLRKSLLPLFGSTVIRCATCDYHYDNTKRRKPPHPYEPVVVSMPRRRLTESWRWRGDKPASYESLAGIKDIPSVRANKVHRMKRRRSSTELYKGLVSVD